MEDVLAIEQESFREDAWERKVFEGYYHRWRELFLVAKRGRRIAGYMISCGGARDAELASIAVRAKDRRAGVGRALVEFTMAQLTKQRTKSWWLMVEVDNAAAIRFYESYGFARTKRIRRYYGAGRDAWRMRFRLEIKRSGPQQKSNKQSQPK